jgi:hypothetical protein
MATIKLKDGKVILKDGKASCVCCDPCAGLWGLGYDTHPNTVTVSGPSSPNFTGTRVLKCDWVEGGVMQFVQYVSGSNRWHCHKRISGVPTSAYKNGTFSDGPLGDYNLSGDGTSALFTVT